MLSAFQNHLNLNLPFLFKGKLLIAISGGLDSVVLAHLCKTSALNFALAHCNFNLRAAESDADEAFVLDLAEDLDLEVFIESFETEEFAKKHKVSIQVAARELRYDWFQQLSQQLDFDYILTAHHADDNLETFLINFTRGTGLEGLTGIPEVNDNVVRPLLPFSREDLEVYAIGNKIEWREDSSNASKKYLRNKLRHDIIPTLKQMNPQLLQNFKTTISNLQDAQQLVDDSLIRAQKKVISVDDDLIKLDVKKIKKLSNPKAYLYELLKDFNFTEWNDVVGLLDAQTGKQVFSDTHRLLRNRDYLLLSAINSEEETDEIQIFKEDKTVETPLGILFFDEADAIFKTEKNTILVDAETLKYPLTIRKWEDGDYFHPIGMKGKKKVSKYLKDEKLSRLDKEKVYVLSSDSTIVWIIGMRADERFKVKQNTNKLLKITLQ
ncbi:tRNA lysidine(34) synthetase TilS [Subsaxibacter sp. CAU 1640]|uniref:tRNA lysidine(34) synthetase TilS n=1 Tax=Subsaxibacter sp. CAU 1640 TaxID=2933271 RepID=UPI00200604B9|nr:tRNA lysidine(34) synthetase TilS [Subsaxibacter sp. CAU 1640]MCK7591186.1 tRNA lysidine(34) synthetase TilS [Subsaxibacter sp. CAU 1640]